MKKEMLFAVAVAAGIWVCPAGEDYAKWADPLVGTVGEGNTFPGACSPFGMVQAGPDTGTGVWCPGYKHTDTTIRGFSQTHLNGTGLPGMGDVTLMPFTGEFDDGDTSSPFRKENQFCTPDYYSVVLDKGGVKCEATTSERVAWWRFTYPKGSAKKLYVDGNSQLMMPWNIKQGPRILEATSELNADRTEICGYKKGRGWNTYTLYYSVKFGRAWSKIEKLPQDAFDGYGDRYVVEFAGDEPVTVQVALSGTSEAGARANREAETAGKTFEAVRAENRAAWNRTLGRMTLEKGTEMQKRNWYTAAYRLCIQPNVQTDVDGKYRTADDRVEKAVGEHYSTFSLWDTFRAAHPLYTLAHPERVDDFVRSMISVGRTHGHLPTWTMFENETHQMIGVHSIPVIVDAWVKGFRGFDAEEALRLMVKSMTAADADIPPNCWNAYWENGYIPYYPGVFDLHTLPRESVSRTLEYAYDWWCIAHMAKETGNKRTAKEAGKYAGYWENVFDERVGFARPRAPKNPGKGEWIEPFDPRIAKLPGQHWSAYTEANSWIYTWHVFQEPERLMEKLGGKEKTVAKLDEFFSTPPVGAKQVATAVDGKIIDGKVGQYWHGNEPSHHIVYFYTLAGAPEKAAKMIRRICRDAYEPTPEGLCGNDDCGQMSAWYLFSMMGFYPFNPCTGEYVIGAPQAEEMRMNLPNGKTLKILAEGMSEKAACVKAVRLNGKPIEGWKITHAQLLEGGVLAFEMGEECAERR